MDQAKMIIKQLSIDKVFPNPKQPRRIFRESTLRELAESIKEHGMIEPIIVEPHPTGWMIVAGERRWRASKLAGCKTIECVIRDRSNHNGREMLLSAIVENVQREDMNPIDEAMAYRELNIVHEMSPNKIAIKVGTNSKRIYDMLNLLKLDKKVQGLIRDGKLSHDSRLVNALLKIQTAEMQVALAERTVKYGLKIKTVIEAAERLCAISGAKPIGIRKNQTPALSIARKREKNEEQEPPKWNALAQIGKLPAWSLVVISAKTTCAECELRDMANNSTCGRCPLVMMLGEMLEAAQCVQI